MAIYIVTHGEKMPGPNPGLTKEGEKAVRKLRLLLPKNPDEVIVGTGKRHIETMKALDLKPTRINSIIGDSLSEKNGDKKIILLADGTEMPIDFFKKDISVIIGSVKKFIEMLDQNLDIIVITGRIIFLPFNFQGSKTATVYTLNSNNTISECHN